MGILTKMLGTKIFLLLSLTALGYSIPQAELRIIIHLHQDDFQPGPARGSEFGHFRESEFNPFLGSQGGRGFEAGSDYSDDEEETDEKTAEETDKETEGGTEVGEEEDDSDLDDQPVEPQAEETGDDYSDRWAPY